MFNKKNPMRYFSGSTFVRLPLYKLAAGGTAVALTASIGLGAFAAGDTAADGLVAHVEGSGLDTGLFQLPGHSGQGRGRAALGMGTAVDEQDLHGNTPWLKTPGRRRAGTLQIRTVRRE